MIQAKDISFVYSGGLTNSNPALSLGGQASSYPVALKALNNLFNNVSDSDRLNGITDYRCFYAANNHPTDSIYQVALTVTDEMLPGNEGQIGFINQPDVQTVTISTVTDQIVGGDFANMQYWNFSILDPTAPNTPTPNSTITHIGPNSIEFDGHLYAMGAPNVMYQPFNATSNTVYTVSYWVYGEPGSINGIIPQLFDPITSAPLEGQAPWTAFTDFPTAGQVDTDGNRKWQQVSFQFAPTPVTMDTSVLYLMFVDNALINPSSKWYLADVNLWANTTDTSYSLYYPPSITSIAVPDFSAISLQNALNASGVCTGALVTSTTNGTDITHTIKFMGNNDSHYFQLWISQTTGITTAKFQDGSPINNYPTMLDNSKVPPGNVVFGMSTPALNELKAGEVFHIWARRTIVAGTGQVDLDGFTIKIAGNVFTP